MRGPGEDDLFVACTRPAMMLGVPMEAFALILIGCGEAFIITRRIIFMAVLSVSLWLICRALTAIDHNIFRVLLLWVRTKGRSTPNGRWWHGSSSSPRPLRPARRASEIPYHG